MQKVANPVQSTVANHEQHNQENVERWRAGEKNCTMHIKEKRRPRQEMQSRLLKKKTRAEPGEGSPIDSNHNPSLWQKGIILLKSFHILILAVGHNNDPPSLQDS
jgi:hypothetical protein